MIKFFILLISLFFQFFIVPTSIFAAVCEITSVKGSGSSTDIRPSSPIAISAKNLEAGGTYSIFLDLDDTKQTITIPNTSTHTATTTLPLQIETSPGNLTPLIPRRYTLKLQHTTNPSDNCSFPVTIKPAQLTSCTASTHVSPNPNTLLVNVQANNLIPNISHEIRFDGKRMSDSSGRDQIAKTDSTGHINQSFEVTAGQTVQVSLYPIEGTAGGTYECIVPTPLTIDIRPAAVPAPTVAPTPTAAPIANPCTGNGCIKGGGIPCNDPTRGPGIQTAIGCIHTNPTEFVADFFTFAITISGGFAFLMMLLGAFQMITSNGNPESLQNGRSRLTSAMIGLLFVIFATLLMQIIGVDILFKNTNPNEFGFGR